MSIDKYKFSDEGIYSAVSVDDGDGDNDSEEDGDKKGGKTGEVVSLDQFRKK